MRTRNAWSAAAFSCVVFAGWNTGAMAGGAQFSDPFSFCRAVGNADSRGEGSVDDAQYSGPGTPHEAVEALRAAFPRLEESNVVWRCMGGSMYACNLGANGRACIKSEAVRGPTPIVQRFCAEYPGHIVPATQNDTAAQWVCANTAPVLDQRFPQPTLDQRGYMRDAWRKVSPR